MLFLLPHKFKMIGAIAAPLGLIIWGAAQRTHDVANSEVFGFVVSRPISLAIFIVPFFCFLLGSYALAFSKEKVEDEMIGRLRLESFQFAALFQIFVLVMGLVVVGFMNGPPKEGGMMAFFIAIIFLFWLSYIIRFNYMLYVGVARNEK